jgi:hypothetical protein
MLHEVWMNNDAGWEFTALQKFREFAKVLRVDGRGLMGNGRFKQIVVYFGTADDAAAFTQAGAEALGGQFHVF